MRPMPKNTINVPFVVSGMILLFLIAASAAYIPVGAQPTTTYSSDVNKELDDKIKLFFDDILRDNLTKAFEELFRNSSGSEQIAAMRSKLDEAKTQFGSFREYERINAKPVGKDLVFVRYLLKGDQHPVVWTFTFYRRPSETGTLSTNAWSLIGLRFDTNLELLIL